MKLSKSLADLDKLADEMLAKSEAVEKPKASDDDVKPEEISDDSSIASESGAEEGAETKEEMEKGCNCPDDKVKKSEEPEDIEKSEGAESDDNKEGEEEKIEKSEEPAPENNPESEEGAKPAEGNGEDVPEEKTSEEIEKSLKDDFEAEEPIKKGMENSEFMAAVVDVLTKSMSEVQYDTQTAGRAQAQATEVLSKSLQAVIGMNQQLSAENEKLTRRINKLEKSIEMGFEKVMDSLDEISLQPAHMRKSMASVSVHDRDFGSSINGTPTPTGFESLSKSQVMTILNNELYAGNQNVTPQDIISYESGAPLRQDLQSLVASKAN